MIVHYEKKFVYIDIPKTGSMSIEDLLHKYGGKIIRSRSYAKHSLDIPANAKTFDVIVSVRNPYERFSSYYFYQKNNKWPPHGLDTLDKFTEYILNLPKNSRDRSAYLFYPVWQYLELIGVTDFKILKLETINTDLANIGFDYPLSCRNKSKNMGWDSIKTKELTYKINQWAGKDFQLLGYNKDE